MSLVLLQWERGALEGLLIAVLAEWKRLMLIRAAQAAKEQVAASVGLALQKWERGDAQGLFAAILAAWRRLDPVQTKRCK